MCKCKANKGLFNSNCILTFPLRIYTLILIVAANIIYYSIEFENPRLILLVLKNLGSKVTNQRQGKFPERSASVCNVVDSSQILLLIFCLRPRTSLVRC